MAEPRSARRPAWHALRQLPGRTSLRVKLIAAVLLLVGVALAIISVAGVIVFRDYLVSRAGAQVRSQYRDVIASISQGGPPFQVGRVYGEGSPYIAVIRPRGRQLNSARAGYGSQHIPLPDVPLAAGWLGANAGRLVTVSGLNSQDRWLVISAPVRYVDGFGTTHTGTLIVGTDLGDVNGSVGKLATIDVIVGGLVLVGLAVVGVAVVRASLRPLTDIEQTARQIAAGDLGRRVPERDPRTEVGRLGRSLNAMLTQIETAFVARTASEEAARRSEEAARQSEDAARQAALTASKSEERMRQFVADASHELRTPLTAIRGFAEYYRQRGGVRAGRDAADGQLARADLDRIIERVEQEATRMGVLVDDMLLLARLDQQRPPDFRTVDLLAIAADALHDARVIAPQRSINLTVGTPAAALVVGDEVSLRQVVGNLMSNAMTHTPDGTPIDITIRAGTLRNGHQPPAGGEPAVVLEVNDRGPGLSREQQEHVFERFYRTDRARSRTAGGTGLGLAIVAALVSAHHGRVWVESQPGQGSTFGFALPLAPEARPADA